MKVMCKLFTLVMFITAVTFVQSCGGGGGGGGSAGASADGVTNMADCFRGCISLTEAPKIPNSVTDMSYCFANCTSLTQALEISNSVTNMAGCFSGCTSLKTVELTIDSWWETCFSGFSAIVSITVPTENIKNSIINAGGNDIVKDKIVVKP